MRPLPAQPHLARTMLALLALISACSGDRFSSNGAAAGSGAGGRSGGGQAGQSGASAAGGAAGRGSGGIGAGGASSAGTESTAGAGAGGVSSGGVGGASAGSGGSAVAGEAGMETAGTGGGCACAQGQYCRVDKCYACSDFSQLDFAPPEDILEYPSGDLRFPRVGDRDGSLFFTLVTSTVSELWYAADLASSPGAPVNMTNLLPRAGLDYFGDPGGLGFDVLFTETGSDGRRSLRAAAWQAAALANVVDPPVPLAASGFDDYSVTLARATKRAYWMTTASGTPELMTGTVGTDAAGVVALTIAASGGATCPRQGDDATPWVTPDGSLLLFRALPVDQACTPLDGVASDLYAAPLSPTSGLPLTRAVALPGVNTTSGGSSETDASLSSDECTLYLASDGGSAQSQFHLYRAVRR